MLKITLIARFRHFFCYRKPLLKEVKPLKFLGINLGATFDWTDHNITATKLRKITVYEDYRDL